MSYDPGGRRVSCEMNGVFSAPAEPCGTNFEIGCWEWRRRGSQGLKEGEDAGFGD